LQQADHGWFGDGLKQHVFAPGVAIGGGDARGRALHEPVPEKLLNLLRELEQLSIAGAIAGSVAQPSFTATISHETGCPSRATGTRLTRCGGL